MKTAAILAMAFLIGCVLDEKSEVVEIRYDCKADTLAPPDTLPNGNIEYPIICTPRRQ